MAFIRKTPDIREKLSILSHDSQYDLACACGTGDNDRRHRAPDDKWIYPVTLPDGGSGYLFKSLVSNVCVNDCAYCPLRAERDPRRCTVTPEEIVRVFLEYYRSRRVFGLFLSSGVAATPDSAMARINSAAALLRRREGFRGYIHLKVIPGASDAAIEEAVSLASAVSVNIETAGQGHFERLCTRKDYLNDIIRPIRLVSRLTAKGESFAKVKQTTQFVVGASDETDHEIVKYSWGLYRRLGLHRVYFSAYQRGLGRDDLPGERSALSNRDLLTREHRLYQADWLLRKYGFCETEIPFASDGNLPLDADPKEAWARGHPEIFPLDINRAGRFELLRVPGFGPGTVRHVLDMRKTGAKIRRLEDIGRMGKRLAKAGEYVKF